MMSLENKSGMQLKVFWGHSLGSSAKYAQKYCKFLYRIRWKNFIKLINLGDRNTRIGLGGNIQQRWQKQWSKAAKPWHSGRAIPLPVISALRQTIVIKMANKDANRTGSNLIEYLWRIK